MSEKNTDHPDGVVIILPDGGAMGGVTTWATHTASGLARYGIDTRIVAGENDVESLSGLALAAARELGAPRVLVMPQLSGVAYAAAAIVADALSADRIYAGVLGFMHTDIRHDIELIRRFAPALGAVGCVSDSARRSLIENGVIDPARVQLVRTGVPDEGPAPAEGPTHEPLRLIYTGRLDPYQKRVLALPEIVQGLRLRGVMATLTIVGDGPGMGPLQEAAQAIKGVTLLGAQPSSAIPGLLAQHDMLLLPSRSEGLGLSRIEAAMRGCVPVVTAGGASEGIVDRTNGLIVQAEPDAEDSVVAMAFAEAIAGAHDLDFSALRINARTEALRLFDPIRFDREITRLVHETLDMPAKPEIWSKIASNPRSWASFSVPEHASAAAAALATSLGPRRVVLHGAGAHTDAVWRSLSPLQVIAIADDDPAVWTDQSPLGVPIIPPQRAGEVGATDVIISSWIHQDSIWNRRAIYEREGLCVHRLYESAQMDAESA